MARCSGATLLSSKLELPEFLFPSAGILDDPIEVIQYNSPFRLWGCDVSFVSYCASQKVLVMIILWFWFIYAHIALNSG